MIDQTFVTKYDVHPLHIFYDISNHVTFLNAKELLNKEGIEKYANTNVVIMLCFGRSVDLQCHKNMPSSEVVK